MTWCAFLGDEVSAAGFRLAGVEVFQPGPEEVAALLDRLWDQVQLILISAELAALLPQGRLQAAQLADWPLVLIVPDVRGRCSVPDPAAALRRQLGLGE
ncbi:V-type ATP synthase subunit F [Thiorhodococcus minor]|uniref:Vacuolar H+transporting two-sector ATPase F subunit n=1 Tax=Thiorhodococcus minor TaxID=57489 RepID=A0A6M0JZT4_9GAMM|nr:V-type ATP synthase subunit F [Thiorhodococcus minor]NEV61847.1 Vacuolar H+transporting two-sector ATPase F subunit [Thiorhodococcus minor]